MLFIKSRGETPEKRRTCVKVPGAFSRKGLGPILAPSASSYGHLETMQESGSASHRHGNNRNMPTFNLNSVPKSFGKHRDTERTSTQKGKKWNRSTSIVSREPQKFLHSTTFTPSSSPMQGSKRFPRSQTFNRQGRRNMLNSKIHITTETQSSQRMKERYQYGFLNVRDLKQRSKTVQINMDRAKEKIDARKRKIDAMKVKLRRVDECIDQKEMYSKLLLNAISYVSNRLMYGKSVENQTKSDTQYTSKLGATTTGFKEGLHEFPQSNIIYGDGFSEPDVEIPSLPKNM